MAYSMELRERVLAAKQRGMSTSQVAAAFGVAASWVRRLAQWQRERGDIAPRLGRGGREPMIQPEQDRLIHAHFQAHPDTTIADLKAALGTPASEVTVWRAARRLGYRFKKSRSTHPSVIAPTSSRRGGRG